MKWPLATSLVIGGMRPAKGKAPFARGAAVLGSAHAPGRFLQVHRYEAVEAEGDEFEGEAWDGLLSSFQAVSLKHPVPAIRDAALWVFREGFLQREAAMKDLELAGAILHQEVAEPGGPAAVVVREDLGNPVRDALALKHFDAGWQELQAQRWSDAVKLADLAFVLTRSLMIDRVALYALALDRAGRKTGSDGLIEMAAGSRGKAFGEAVRQRVALYAEQCPVKPSPGPTTARGRRFGGEMRRKSNELLRGSPIGRGMGGA